MSGVPLSIDLLARLKDTFPNQFMGIKDFWRLAFAGEPLVSIGKIYWYLTGMIGCFTLALHSKAAGCITALANHRYLRTSPDLGYIPKRPT
jgi:hypothetical protein